MIIVCIFFSIIIYFIGLISFCVKRKHLLLILLSLEFVVLSLYFNLYLYIIFFNYEYYFRILFISIRVCEGALGLSILVCMVRTHRNDNFQSFNILW